MFGITYQHSDYMLVWLICSRIEYTIILLRRGTHRIRAGYIYNSI